MNTSDMEMSEVAAASIDGISMPTGTSPVQTQDSGGKPAPINALRHPAPPAMAGAYPCAGPRWPDQGPLLVEIIPGEHRTSHSEARSSISTFTKRGAPSAIGDVNVTEPGNIDQPSTSADGGNDDLNLQDVRGNRITFESVKPDAPTAEEVIDGLKGVVSQHRIFKNITPEHVRYIRHLIGYYRSFIYMESELVLKDHIARINIEDFGKASNLADRLAPLMYSVILPTSTIKDGISGTNMRDSPLRQEIAQAADLVLNAARFFDKLPRALGLLDFVARTDYQSASLQLEALRHVTERAHEAVTKTFRAAGKNLSYDSGTSQGTKMVHWVVQACIRDRGPIPSPSTVSSKIRRRS